MKLKLLFIILLSALPFILLAQKNIKKIFLDEEFNQVDSGNRAWYTAYTGKPEGSQFYSMSVFNEEGNLMMNASYQDENLKIKAGETIIYQYVFDEEGYPLSTYMFSKENYLDNQLNGRQQQFDASGKAVVIAHYKNGVLHGDFVEFLPFSNQERIIKIGRYENGKKEGDWILGETRKLYTYKQGKVIAVGRVARQP